VIAASNLSFFAHLSGRASDFRRANSFLLITDTGPFSPTRTFNPKSPVSITLQVTISPFTLPSNVIETGDFGLKVRVGENGPVSVIKRNELALRKSDARPERWAKNDKLDAAITNIDQSSYKISLSVRTMEETTEREAMEKYGSKDSGASLGAILGKALGRDKKED
jgi:hypothetical protein